MRRDGVIDALHPWAIYPVALAEKIAGEPLNGDIEGDIELNVNSSVTGIYGTDGNISDTQVRPCYSGPS